MYNKKLYKSTKIRHTSFTCNIMFINSLFHVSNNKHTLIYCKIQTKYKNAHGMVCVIQVILTICPNTRACVGVFTLRSLQ